MIGPAKGVLLVVMVSWLEGIEKGSTLKFRAKSDRDEGVTTLDAIRVLPLAADTFNAKSTATRPLPTCNCGSSLSLVVQLSRQQSVKRANAREPILYI